MISIDRLYHIFGSSIYLLIFCPLVCLCAERDKCLYYKWVSISPSFSMWTLILYYLVHGFSELLDHHGSYIFLCFLIQPSLRIILWSQLFHFDFPDHWDRVLLWTRAESCNITPKVEGLGDHSALLITQNRWGYYYIPVVTLLIIIPPTECLACFKHSSKHFNTFGVCVVLFE